eukprot:7743844-Alexandrium_andersonii.AAC.1
MRKGAFIPRSLFYARKLHSELRRGLWSSADLVTGVQYFGAGRSLCARSRARFHLAQNYEYNQGGGL